MRICGANCHKIAPCLCVTDLIRYMPMAQRNRLSLPVPTCAVMRVYISSASDVYRPPFLKTYFSSGYHCKWYRLHPVRTPHDEKSRVLCNKECIGKITKNSSYILRFLLQIVNKHSVIKYKHFITGRVEAFLFIHEERLSIPVRKAGARLWDPLEYEKTGPHCFTRAFFCSGI